jgi:hypothetical protein
MDTGTNPDALTQDDVQLLTDTAALLEESGIHHVATGLRDIAARVLASIEVAS